MEHVVEALKAINKSLTLIALQGERAEIVRRLDDEVTMCEERKASHTSFLRDLNKRIREITNELVEGRV